MDQDLNDANKTGLVGEISDDSHLGNRMMLRTGVGNPA